MSSMICLCKVEQGKYFIAFVLYWSTWQQGIALRELARTNKHVDDISFPNLRRLGHSERRCVQFLAIRLLTSSVSSLGGAMEGRHFCVSKLSKRNRQYTICCSLSYPSLMKTPSFRPNGRGSESIMQSAIRQAVVNPFHYQFGNKELRLPILL